jgi:ABC-type Mn2+/Zn2+ transport system permease subunit
LRIPIAAGNTMIAEINKAPAIGIIIAIATPVTTLKIIDIILVSVLVGFIGMIGGLTGSYYLDTPPGATITLGFILLFLVINNMNQSDHQSFQ